MGAGFCPGLDAHAGRPALPTHSQRALIPVCADRFIPEREAESVLSHAERACTPCRAQDMPLGSGIAEVACATVVSTRAKKSGLRWTPDDVHTQPVL